MRQQIAENQSYVKGTSRMYNGKDDYKLRKYAKGRVAGHGRHHERIIDRQLKSLNKYQKTSSWHTHRSMVLFMTYIREPSI